MEIANSNGALPLKSINHISILCRSVEKSSDFYQNVLGFFPVLRPGSFDFDGAWLFNYGIGIHIIKTPDLENLPKKREINPKDNHISFQCESMYLVENRLKEMDIQYVKTGVEENGIYLDQLFFHDPDGFMIEICNCDNLPVIPVVIDEPVARVCKRLNFAKNQLQLEMPDSYEFVSKAVRVEEPQINCA